MKAALLRRGQDHSSALANGHIAVATMAGLTVPAFMEQGMRDLLALHSPQEFELLADVLRLPPGSRAERTERLWLAHLQHGVPGFRRVLDKVLNSVIEDYLRGQGMRLTGLDSETSLRAALLRFWTRGEVMERASEEYKRIMAPMLQAARQAGGTRRRDQPLRAATLTTSLPPLYSLTTLEPHRPASRGAEPGSRHSARGTKLAAADGADGIDGVDGKEGGDGMETSEAAPPELEAMQQRLQRCEHALRRQPDAQTVQELFRVLSSLRDLERGTRDRIVRALRQERQRHAVVVRQLETASQTAAHAAGAMSAMEAERRQRSEEAGQLHDALRVLRTDHDAALLDAAQLREALAAEQAAKHGIADELAAAREEGERLCKELVQANAITEHVQAASAEAAEVHARDARSAAERCTALSNALAQVQAELQGANTELERLRKVERRAALLERHTSLLQQCLSQHQMRLADAESKAAAMAGRNVRRGASAGRSWAAAAATGAPGRGGNRGAKRGGAVRGRK